MSSFGPWRPALRRAVALAIVAVASIGANASGDEEKEAWWQRGTIWYAARVGYLNVQDVDGGGLVLGGAGGIFLSPHLGLSVGIDGLSHNYDLESRDSLSLTVGLEVDILSYRYRVQPYVLGGAGFYYSEAVIEDEDGRTLYDDFESEGGWHVGGGLDINIDENPAERLAINIEYRRIFSNPEPAGYDIEPDGTQITVGIRVKLRE